MGSSFFEMNIGVTGLFAAQKALSVTSNNITNVNTKGYSRQVVVQKAGRALMGASKGMNGTGTDIVDIKRQRDFYLDLKYWKQINEKSEYDLKAIEMSQLTTLFNEPSDEGINKTFQNFFDSLQDLTTNSTDSSYYEAVRQNANEVSSYFNSMASYLEDMQTSINNDLRGKVDLVNSYASRIQTLNVQINKLEINGDEASALRDERESMIDELSKIVNVDVEEREFNTELINGINDANERARSNRQYVIKVMGQELVNHDQVNKLVVKRRDSKFTVEDTAENYDIVWESGIDFNEHAANLKGEIRALIDIRDGNANNCFKGKVQSQAGDIVTLSNVNRYDIPSKGSITVGSTSIAYDSYTYDEKNNTVSIHLTHPQTLVNGVQVQVGKDVEYKGIPYYQNRLNQFVRTFARAINNGESLDGSKIEGLTGTMNGYMTNSVDGVCLFTYNGADGLPLESSKNLDYWALTAKNFSLSKEYNEDARNISISASKNPKESQADLISELASLGHKDLFKEGEAIDFISSIISEIAIDVKHSNKFSKLQEELSVYTDNRRQSVSGVQQNEEMSNLIKYQAAYQAAAKIINVVDQIYNTTINGLMN